MEDLDVHDYGAYSDVGDDDHDAELCQHDCCNPLFAESEDDHEEAWDWDDGEAYELHIEDAASVCVPCKNPDAGYSMFDTICDHHLTTLTHRFDTLNVGAHTAPHPASHARDQNERILDVGRERLVLLHSQNLVRAARVWESVRIIRLIMLRKRFALDVDDICRHPCSATTLAHLPIEILEVILLEAKGVVFDDIAGQWPYRGGCHCPKGKRFDDIEFWRGHTGFREWLNTKHLDAISELTADNELPRSYDVTTSMAWKAMYPSAEDATDFAEAESDWDSAIDHAARHGVLDQQDDETQALFEDYDHSSSQRKPRRISGFNKSDVFEYYCSPQGRLARLDQLLSGGPGSQYVQCHMDICRDERNAMFGMLRRLSSQEPFLDVGELDYEEDESRVASHILVGCLLSYTRIWKAKVRFQRTQRTLASVHTFLRDHNLIVSAATTAEDVDRCLYGVHREGKVELGPSLARYLSTQGPYLVLYSREQSGVIWQRFFQKFNIPEDRTFHDHANWVRPHLFGYSSFGERWRATHTVYT